MRYRNNAFIQVFCAGLLGAAVWLAAPAQAAAQYSCSNDGSFYTCNIAAGSYSSAISIGESNPQGLPFQVFAAGTMTVAASDQQNAALSFTNDAAWGTSSQSQGAGADGLIINNTGSITLTPDQNPIATYFFGLYSRMTGGQGYAGNPGKNQTLNGGNTAQLSLTNSGAITIDLPNVQIVSGGALYALSQGGSGGSNGSEIGGAGGTSGGAVITNNGAITASLAGQDGFGGIEALGIGGSAGAGGNSVAGGGGGVAWVTNSAPVTVTWNWQNTDSANYGLFGILAQSQGGLGGSNDLNKSQSNALSAGVGGAGNQANVTLSAGGDVTVTATGTGPSSSGLSSAGVGAESVGGDGGSAGKGNKISGGNGGPAAAVTIFVTDANVETATQYGALPAILAYAQGGNGGTPNPSCANSGIVNGGGDSNCNASQNGGNAGGVSSDSDTTINIIAQMAGVTISADTPNGSDSPAIASYAYGGSGGNGGGNYASSGDVNGGNGGNGGDTAPVNIALLAAQDNISVSASGADSPGIYANNEGGNGGNAGFGSSGCCDTGGANGGNGGSGGNAGDITINLEGSPSGQITVMTNGDKSPGIFALSAGGAGGTGGDAESALGGLGSQAGSGGDGGEGGNVGVVLSDTSITTAQTSSPGIVAVTSGGAAGTAGTLQQSLSGNGGNGGNGGSTGTVTVTLDASSSITTQGTNSMGVLAESLSGAGGNGGGAHGTGSVNAGAAGKGGSAGAVTVTNAGTISTAGATARGILAQSLAGAGGNGQNSWAVLHSSGGAGGVGGTAGTVTIADTGDISTQGSNAEGVLAQSIGGLGGAGGQAGGLFDNVGGNANDSIADGGTVVINSAVGGSIVTSGPSAPGILGQSIGGGGGDGGGASGVAVTVGGFGGAGGIGGVVTYSSDDSQIMTNGALSPAVAIQSIGGGGGNAGNASTEGLFTSVAIGGTAGDGGNGGLVAANVVDTTVTTSGSKAAGLVAQSIGGGGGTGGSAFSGSIGAGFDASVAIGGAGGLGGDGGTAQATVTGGLIATGQDPLLINGQLPASSILEPGGDAIVGCQSLPCNTLPVDDYGAVIQSIGGGGGLGGSATSQAIAVSIPVTDAGSQVAVAAAVALGGSGGSGGNGGTAQFSLSDGGKITTSGAGSTAVLVQSIGGGGGAGGDSSALAAAIGFGQTVPDDATSIDITPTFTVGGDGGNGGNGGPVQVAIGGTISNDLTGQDSSGSAPTGISTYGDFADGIKAQSIGGGGGDAGFGSGNTQFFGSGNNTMISVDLGSTGGSGGSGGTVDVDLFPGDGITTYGSGAAGIIAQSIGGGGGTSQGGSIDVGQTFTVGTSTIRPGLKLALGEQGGSGNVGGAVSVSAEAPIATHGGDATGILAQSIGGGGGLGGSAGADASADNPIVAVYAAREGVSNIKDYVKNQLSEEQNGGLPFDATFALSIGGSGGTGGNGGNVGVSLSAPITTTGDWADGVVAQSVGGGGGKGGSAAASGTGGLPEVTVNADVAVGGTGGAGGNGGAVAVDLEPGSSLSTAGFDATGIVAQSVGGGGGIGADGSDSATGLYSVGGTGGGGGGSGGNGGSVSVTDNSSIISLIATSGAAADGVDAQSIGGGGGIAGAGSSLFQSNWKESGSVTLSAGGGAGDSGAGGTVTFAPANDSDSPFVIQTTGNDSYGILAQSIGDGGGIVTSQPSGSSVDIEIGGQWSNGGGGGGAGGAVNVTLPNQSTITATGVASDGIVAQSIGGGGGVIRLVNADGDSPGLTTAMPSGLGASPQAATGSGGIVTIVDSGTVNVTGAGGIGIVAQSIGGGGGLITDGGVIYAGSPNASEFCNACSYAAGGAVSVTTNGLISATGDKGIGIFAQSTGYGPSGQVTVTVNGPVVGGSGSGATDSSGGSSAVVIDTPIDSPPGQLTVNADGSLQTLAGVAGTAVLASGGGEVNLTNYGKIVGSTYLNADPGTFTNYGIYDSGSNVQGNLVNSGQVYIGGRASPPVPGALSFSTTTVTGNFVQTSGGTLQVGTDFNTGAGDTLAVNGQAKLSGSIKILPSSVVPVAVPVITATGGVSGQLIGQSSTLYAYDLQQSSSGVTVTPRATGFDLPSFDLNSAESEVAQYLTTVFDHAQPGSLGYLFADLGDFADAGGPSYAGALGQMAPGTMFAFASQRLMQTQAFANGLFSCRNLTGVDIVVTERGCAYASVIGGTTHQASGSGYGNFTLQSVSWQLGGQIEVAPSWELSGALAYQEGWLTGTDNTTGSNSTGYFGAGVIHQIGGWQLGVAAFGSVGSTQTTRDFTIPEFETTLSASPDVDSVGGRAQVAYRATAGRFYIQPTLDLDLIDVYAGSASEGSVLNAEQLSSSQATFAVTPLVELGMNSQLSPAAALRSFVSLGVSVPSNDKWQQQIRFAAAPGVGEFTASMPMSGTAGVVNAGVQLLTGGRFDLEAAYSGVFSGRVASNTIALNAKYQF